jgi:hypothetical protein
MLVEAERARPAVTLAPAGAIAARRAHTLYPPSPAVKMLERSTLRVLQGSMVHASARNIGLLLDECVQTGTLLAVFPLQPQLGQSPALTARVVRAEPQSDRFCYAACALLRPLTQAELNAFLA